ncbi:MAG: hypothetical protein OEW19_06350 [Acidobacteriota bacterium]|nr:hypothetical protein [Acidobacteriota bacterium]
MSDAEIVNDRTEPTEDTGERQPAQPIESRFLFVDVSALRAKQLRRGAKSRLEPGEPEPIVPQAFPPAPVAPPVPGAPVVRKIKAERVAMQEVRNGLVEWSLPDFKAVFDTR